jgi:hypothetical protein
MQTDPSSVSGRNIITQDFTQKTYNKLQAKSSNLIENSVPIKKRIFSFVQKFSGAWGKSK